jgi:hypothetical protein
MGLRPLLKSGVEFRRARALPPPLDVRDLAVPGGARDRPARLQRRVDRLLQDLPRVRLWRLLHLVRDEVHATERLRLLVDDATRSGRAHRVSRRRARN